jgi:ribonuclease R
LLVHRSLIKAFDLGAGGLSDEEMVTLEERAEHISQTERTSAEAERNSIDRFTAKWMSQRIGDQFAGRINGVTRFGLFVTLDENGADGLIPIRTLPQDYYVHDEQQHALIGKRTGIVYRLGAKLTIKIVEADGFTGSSLFEVVGREGADLSGVKFRTTNNKGLQKKHSSNKDNATGKRDGRRAIGKHKPKKGGKRR